MYPFPPRSRFPLPPPLPAADPGSAGPTECFNAGIKQRT